MIAKLTYRDGDGAEHSATLGDDATWTGDDAEMAATLNALAASADRSPAMGSWPVAHAKRMARMLAAAAEFEAKDEPPAGMLY